MDLKQISFCDKSSFNVNSNKYKKYILERINYDKIIKGKNVHNYKNIYQKELLNNDYLVSEITRANNYILLLFTDNLNKKVCLLIDCKTCKGYEYPRINFINYRFAEELYNNTLLTCELLKTKTGWTLLVTDILSYRNKNTSYLTFYERLEKIYYIFKNQYKQDDNLEICRLGIKQYKYKDMIGDLNSKFGYNFIPNNPNLEHFKYRFKTDKINSSGHSSSDNNNNNNNNKVHIKPISTNDKSYNEHSTRKKTHNPINNPINNPTNTHNTHNKTSKKLTLKITKGHMPGIYFLHARNYSDLETLGVARIVGLKTNQMIQELFNHNISEKKVLCEYNSKFKKWVPLSVSNKDISSIKDTK